MELDGLNAARPVEVFETEIDELDRCAACSEVIGFDKLGRATCRNGHEWRRYKHVPTSRSADQDLFASTM